MELRHLRYFIAVAEEGSLLQAAERRLHTAQPSLSRQIRDLEMELGVKLLERKARGIELTAAGRVFLDHARLALMQIDVACEAARNTERPHKPGFSLGFLPGQEVIWLTEALRVLRDDASGADLTITTKSSPELANALMQGEIDVALLRRETKTVGLDFKFLTSEPLVAILPARHRLARHKAIRPEDICREDFISTARAAPVLKTVIEEYAARVGIKLKQIYDAETLSGGMSLVASTGGFTLLPSYVQNALIRSVVARPLHGEVPTIDLVMGYNKSNTSPLLKKFLQWADEHASRESNVVARPLNSAESTARVLRRGKPR
ncbi:LysR family transcriptional regulator [Terriglobus roseus]|uniref:LysR family transcriptional regulator, hca operon transcriptional activator n=1 Tax=Terriglobus roseus TaxID=392734 RepID=A0A1G7HYU5_9BACT|nr:LysR family transcriptional regulator [Terriglobus roseus]SDF05304.1 LysR family transcriptional regulator, hca operon transcriptional activator [Terriglobus roseus]